MPNSALPVGAPPPAGRPLAELPALAIADSSRDVRGWQIQSEAGEVLGVVSDLLADPDRLVAEFLLVSAVNAGGAQVVVPVAALAAQPSHLVLGSGLQPITLRYVSTTRLTVTVAGVTAILIIIVWLLRTYGC
jgi:hypothetical protein